MKTKTPVSTKKHSVTLKDLTTKKNPKGGAPCSPSPLDKTGKGGAINPIPGVDIIVRKERPCWVAREVYGVENPEWQQFRDWLLGSGSSKFVTFYKANGAAIAHEIATQPKTKELIRHLMDAVKGTP